MRANIAIDGLASEELLEDWMWLLKKPHTLIAMTNFGDLFVQDKGGHVHFLDLVSGDLKEVANSTAELQQLVAQKENQKRWFLTDLLTQLEHAGLLLSPGQCFGFKIPPALGGRVELSNVEIVPLAVHISLMGQIHQQVKDLPAGTRIKGFKIG
jgi:hypothetical protein